MPVNEDLCFKRLSVALKRRDWRMFSQGLEKLEDELDGNGRLAQQQRWRKLCLMTGSDEGFPPELAKKLETLLEDSLSRPPLPRASAGRSVAVLAAWTGSIDSAARETAALLLEQGKVGQQAAEQLKSDVKLSSLLDQASVAGVCGEFPSWGEALHCALFRALRASTPAFPRIGKMMERWPTLALLTDDPSLSWERHAVSEGLSFSRQEEGEGMRLLKLAGSVDWFYCPHCRSTSLGHGGTLSMACDRCGHPSRPLIVPMESPHFFPPPLRRIWEEARKALASASAWILSEPPINGEESPLGEMLSSLRGDRPVLVISSRPHVVKAWSERWDGVHTALGSPEDLAAIALDFAKESG